jgi:hypothetical protein
MQLTKKQKEEILDLFKMVDVTNLDIDINDELKQKWFRFGSYNGMQIASEIIKLIPDRKIREEVTKQVS